MAKYTVDQIAAAARAACFYVTPEGVWLRMQYCELDKSMFCAMDEETGEDHIFEFEDLVDEDVHFEHLTRTVIK